MWKNYLKIAFRNLRRNKGYAAINITGLGAGLACCILLLLYVQEEWSFDQFHTASDRIYRVVTTQTVPGGETKQRADAPPLLGPTLRDTYSGVEETVRLDESEVQIKQVASSITETVLLADPSFFEVFSFSLARGNPKTALGDPKSVVLTAEKAEKLFGEADPVGRRLTVFFDEQSMEATVTGIVEEAPANSSIQYGLIMPYENAKYQMSPLFRRHAFTTWDMPVGNTYVLLASPDRAGKLEAQLPDFVATYYDEEAESTRLHLQPITEAHLTPEIAAGLEPPSSPVDSYLMAGIALLVLAIACINFITLSLGQSVGRAREVGVRKTVGARKGQLFSQFWGEAMLTTGLALLLGLGLARLFLPVFNDLAGKELELHVAADPYVLLSLLGLMGIVGLTAGGYPALVLSRFAPSSVLRGQAGPGGRYWLVRSLVVLQFALSIGLVACMIVMSQQLDYLLQKDLGFEDENLVVISAGGSSSEGGQIYEAFRNEISRYDAVRTVSASMSTFPGGGIRTQLQSREQIVTAYVNPVDTSFTDAMDIPLSQGRGLSTAREEVLVNEALVRAMGWQAPVGKTLNFAEGATFREAFEGMRVAGVIGDYHFQSLHEEVEPLILAPRAVISGGVMKINVRISEAQTAETLALLEETWTQVAAEEVPFQYEFVSQLVERQYETERQQREVVRYASVLALLIACMGLFGLAALSVARRTKEIGVRKVFGASASHIALTLSGGFAKLVFVGFILTVPAMYFVMQRWLSAFAYRIQLRPWHFVFAGVIAATVALATVSYQAIRAALTNPADTLRYE